ncbi:peptidyl-prolyl cis-trans isomerase ppi1 [Diplocarpon rosae]|nr:peptidyl-prolyl cis-trans isomerase ppi1 [Diplocarpon rosae]
MAINITLETTMVYQPYMLLREYTNSVHQGTIFVELYNDHAPKTCKNFSTLVSRGYYDTLLFHRIIPVTRGLGVVKRMGLVRTGAEDRPVEEVRILKARIVTDGEEV